MLKPSQIEVPDDEVAAVLRRMTPEERLAVAGRLWVSARGAVESIVRAENPEFSKKQVRQEIVRRMLPELVPILRRVTTAPPAAECPGGRYSCGNMELPIQSPGEGG